MYCFQGRTHVDEQLHAVGLRRGVVAVVGHQHVVRHVDGEEQVPVLPPGQPHLGRQVVGAFPVLGAGHNLLLRIGPAAGRGFQPGQELAVEPRRVQHVLQDQRVTNAEIFRLVDLGSAGCARRPQGEGALADLSDGTQQQRQRGMLAALDDLLDGSGSNVPPRAGRELHVDLLFAWIDVLQEQFGGYRLAGLSPLRHLDEQAPVLAQLPVEPDQRQRLSSTKRLRRPLTASASFRTRYLFSTVRRGAADQKVADRRARLQTLAQRFPSAS